MCATETEILTVKIYCIAGNVRVILILRIAAPNDVHHFIFKIHPPVDPVDHTQSILEV